ncbi:hypothetical protein [Cryptosporangium sp. NPDC048952]
MQGAATSILLATASTTGAYYEDEHQVALEPFAQDRDAADRLWHLGLTAR